jgi:glutathione S-transferase
MPPILYGNRESGHSYKAALFFALAGVRCEYRSVDLERPRSDRLADFVAASPYGEVPVLVEDGVALAQSNAILLHLARRYKRFGATSEVGWDKLTQWLFWEANRIGFSIPNLRHARRWARDTPADVVRWLHGRADVDLNRLDTDLESSPFLVGAAPTIADIACSAYLFWLDQAGFDGGEWPAVAAWLARLRALPGFRGAHELFV